jgi:hypothetical protein
MIRPEYLKSLFVPKEPTENQPPPDWSRPFAILTAYNPGGRKQDTEANEESSRKLRQALSRKSLPKYRVTAVSEDWSHEEKSFAVWELTHAAAAQIGRDFGQDAYFWVENGTVSVHSCQLENPPAPASLGRWEDRLRTHGDRPTRNVYVIRLDPVGMQNKKRFWKANPGYKKGHDLLYVGTSILTPAERFEQHQEDTNANRYVRDHGVALAEEYFSGLPKLTANNYEDKEKEYADQLRSQGHAVWQN